LTTPGLFPYVLGLLWECTGDRELVAPLIEPALKALRWHDTGGDLNGDGFSEYLSRSQKGVQNQGWKDSGDAIVYEDGSQVKPPIAPCEEQGYLYASKIRMAELLSWFDREDEARALFRQASELRKRFNEAFWMRDQGFFALGLDGQRRQIRAISSNPGHLLGSGIVDDSLARQTADRLMQHDLFSGWGVRTLSTKNPAYDPFSYQRGSVWPVENGMFVVGFERWGFYDHMERLARSLFESAGLFEHYRLPEVFSGHARDAAHPFPALYLKANWPQAWSAASVFYMVSGLTGVHPYAPLNALFVDPHLPEWLPELTVTNLHVGESAATIRFRRNPDGKSDFDVREVRGDLKIIRQSQPWLALSRSGGHLKDTLHDLVESR
jgi:glycogen debranching enzyme